jgi:trehalose 6-phosphate synthase
VVFARDKGREALPQIAIVANRAPFSPTWGKDRSPLQRPASGLVNVFDSLRMHKDVTWFAVPMSDAERKIAQCDSITQQGFEVRFIPVDSQTYHYAYNEVYNGIFWPICHGMTDWASRRLRTSRWEDLWHGYKHYNRQVAEMIADHLLDESLVLAQDLYFVFMAAELGQLGAVNLKSILFLHLPFANPAELAVLPVSVVVEILSSMTRFGAVGFQTQRWERAFIRCCYDFGIEPPRTFVAPVAPPIKRLSADRSSPECDKELACLEATLGGRHMLTQLDRMDPAKNIYRSLQAYDVLLETRPEITDKVVFILLAQPSRQGLDDYRAYSDQVRRLCQTINEKHGSPSWQPVLLREDFPHLLHVAALCRYDVLLVNSVRDGMNLIALEGPQLNERHGVSVVSPDVGAFDYQQKWVLRSDPWDAGVTAQALYDALTVNAQRRVQLFNGLCTASAEVSTEDEFVNRQIEAAWGR